VSALYENQAAAPTLRRAPINVLRMIQYSVLITEVEIEEW